MAILILFLSLISLALCGTFPVKHLAGAPSEFNNHRVPNPASILTEEQSASIFIWFQSAKDPVTGVVYTTKVPVDGPNEFVFGFASPHESMLELELIDPNGKVVDLNQYRQKSVYTLGPDLTVPASSYHLQGTIQGYYTLNILSTFFNDDDLELLAESSYPNAVLTVWNNDYVEIESHLGSYVIKQGQEIGIVSTIEDLSPNQISSNIEVKTAVMEVITPSGEDIEIPMTDNDALLSRFGVPPSSGVYAATFTTQSAGEFILQASLEGIYTDDSGKQVPFLRSTEHIIQVSSATLELTGSSSIRPMDPEHVAIDIFTTGTGDKLRAYAEVWGEDIVTNEVKPACWVGGVVENINNAVTLELDLKWLILAGVKPPLTLQNVYVSDMTTSFPVAIATSEMQVQHSEEVIHIDTYSTKIEITQEMRQGRNPLKVNAPEPVAAPTLLMLPGYCSSKNPFAGNANDFTDAAYLNINGANLGHQAFAEKALAFVESLGMNSYSIVGHSQGGMVGLHILNYYFTGMDAAVGSRLIQSVGTPYNGCTAAGSLANLGKLFGVACGSNNDLSVDGAANWLTGITQTSRGNVYYYTTTYKPGLFSSCSIVMNLVLHTPNDGTAETKYTSLSGGNSLGNKEGWCHIEGLNYPPQCTDSTRNVEMNQNAAR